MLQEAFQLVRNSWIKWGKTFCRTDVSVEFETKQWHQKAKLLCLSHNLERSVVCGREPNANAAIYLLCHWSLCINGYFSHVPDPNWDVFCDSWNLQLVILIQLRRCISPHGRWHPVPLFSLMAVAFSTCWGQHLFSGSHELLWAEYCGAFERLSYHRDPCLVWLQGPWFSIRRARPLKTAVHRAVRGQLLMVPSEGTPQTLEGVGAGLLCSICTLSPKELLIMPLRHSQRLSWKPRTL